MTTAEPAKESFDVASGTGRLRVSTLRRMMWGLAEFASEAVASERGGDHDGEDRAGAGSGSASIADDHLPLDLRGSAEPLARVIAATLAAPVLHARVHRRVAGTHAAADIWWSPAASIAIGGHPAACEGGGGPDDDPTLLVIVAPPTALGEQVVRTLRMHEQPAAAEAVVSVDPREIAAALLGERTEPLVGVEPAELVLGEVELAAATGCATFDLPEATPTWSVRTVVPQAGDSAAHTGPAPVVRGILAGPGGCWRIASAEAQAPAGRAVAGRTALPAVDLEPHAASGEQAFFDEAARRAADAVLAPT